MVKLDVDLTARKFSSCGECSSFLYANVSLREVGGACMRYCAPTRLIRIQYEVIMEVLELLILFLVCTRNKHT